MDLPIRLKVATDVDKAAEAAGASKYGEHNWLGRTTDTATAQGLRQHSIGSTFPAIVVGRGVSPTTWEVHLGEHHVDGLTLATAHHVANEVAEVYRKQGWQPAVIRLTKHVVYGVANS